MRILNRLGGIALANAYSCIKAISKKKPDAIAKYRAEFIEGAHRQGLAKKEAADLFGLIEKFAGYGFNKSHSTAYALIAYATAYLKAHYPVEFMAALLTSDIPGRNFKKKDALVEHLEDCQRMGIAVLPPDVNRSGAEFIVAGGKICFALAAVKGCGGAAAVAIARELEQGGPYRSLFDFCERLDPGTVNRTAVESLVKAGALDGLGGRRGQQFATIDRAVQAAVAAASDRRSGQLGLFGAEADEPAAAAANLPDVPDWTPRDQLAKEKEVLGFYLSSHPLAEHEKTLAAYCSHTTAAAAMLKHRTEVMLGGLVSGVKLAHTKNPKPGSPSRYAVFDLEDTAGMIRCILWPEPFVQYGTLVEADAIRVFRGVIDKRPGSEEANLIVHEVIALPDLEARATRSVWIRVLEEQHGLVKLEQLHEILRGYPGKYPLELTLALADGSRVPCQCDQFCVAINPQMQARVEELLGPGNFRLRTATRTGNGRGASR
jgi:DNA polymerase-3 subunit alpha